MLTRSQRPVYSVTRVHTLGEGQQALQAARYDLVLLDLSLPDSTSPLAGVKAIIPGTPRFGTSLVDTSPASAGAHVPALVVLTGSSNDQLGLEALRLGAHDYLQKDGLKAGLLQRTLWYALERKRMADALAAARDEALSSGRAKMAFLANMSHEIRTPLNAILGMTGLLLQSPLSGEQREFTKTAKLAGETLLNIVNDILDYSKVSSGSWDMEAMDLAPGRPLDEALELTATRIENGKVALMSRVAADVPELVVGDPTRLRQILVNLLSNAVKFTKEGEIVASVERIGQVLKWSVTDTGLGLTQAQMDKLFRPFQQADEHPRASSADRGWACLYAKLLSKNGWGNRGRQRVWPGSCFWFTTPLPLEPGVPGAPQRRFEGTQPLRGHPGVGCRAQQDPGWHSYRTVSVPGASATCIDNNDEARDLYLAAPKGSAFDFVLVDVGSTPPESFDWPLLFKRRDHLRRREGIPEPLPGLGYMTSYDRRLEVSKSVNDPTAAFITKPLRMEVLLNETLTACGLKEAEIPAPVRFGLYPI